VTSLAEACADLALWLPAAGVLLAQPDADGCAGGGKPGSMPPWNAQAANAKYDAKAVIRDTEAMFRLIVTGRSGTPRSWSDASTLKALDAIEALGAGLPNDRAARAARDLAGCVTQILRLPAVDEAERPQQVKTMPCPYCHLVMLSIYPRAGRIACRRGYGGICQDADGNAPIGQAGRSQLDGTPQIRWQDGLVT
jgi:hypothetical protein